MAVYFVANIKLTNTEEYDLYLAECSEVFKKYNGRYLAVDDNPIVLEGNYNYSKTVIIEFDNQIDFDSWYHSEEYQRILLFRLQGSECDSVLVHSKNETIKYIRTSQEDIRVRKIIELLDKELYEMYKEKQDEYRSLNILPDDTKAILVLNNGEEIGCGCIKEIENGQYEIKRVFITKEMRGKGISKNIMKELELWAKEIQAEELILETGIKQLVAINLYKSIGYEVTENYGEYINNQNSVCMRKKIER